jgi:hypothetical protein
MKLPFLRTAQHQDEPTVVAMTGVRRGDKVHFWGALPALLLPLAARSGLSGQVTVISPDAAELVYAAEREGLLVDSAPAPLPDAGYDLAVVHTDGAWTSTLEPLLDATRHSGRLIVIAGEPPAGLLGRLRGVAAASGPADADVIAAITGAGWKRVRAIGERDGVRFLEGVRV